MAASPPLLLLLPFSPHSSDHLLLPLLIAPPFLMRWSPLARPRVPPLRPPSKKSPPLPPLKKAARPRSAFLGASAARSSARVAPRATPAFSVVAGDVKALPLDLEKPKTPYLNTFT